MTSADSSCATNQIDDPHDHENDNERANTDVHMDPTFRDRDKLVAASCSTAPGPDDRKSADYFFQCSAFLVLSIASSALSLVLSTTSSTLSFA